MATHGAISKFNPGRDDWSTWIEQLKFYFAANKVTDNDTKRSILLANVAPATFKLAKSLLGTDFANSNFKKIVDKLQEHYEPAPSPIVQRFKFNTRSRQKGESVADYVAALRDIAQHCEYDATLSDMLRDRLVCGVNHTLIQRWLLAEKDLTYEKAYSTAISIEAAERDHQNLKDDKSVQPVNYQSTKKSDDKP